MALNVGFGLAAVNAAAPTTATPAQAATTTTATAAPAAGPGIVLRLTVAPAALAVPRDGRLDGYGFAGSVLGAATARNVDGQPAGPGRTWWVVGMRWQVTAVTPPAAVSVAVVADGRVTRLPLPAGAASSADTGPLYWAVSEPTAAPDVTVEATSQDLTQSFSLSGLRRSGPTPAVLYRTPGQWRTVVPVNRTVERPIPDTLQTSNGGLTIDLRAVTVTDFGPGGPNDTPPAGTGAWLTLTISSTNNPYADTSFYNGLTASQVTLTLPGRAPLDATITPGGGIDNNTGTVLDAGKLGVLPDRYAFAVPAGTTRATLTLTPTNLAVGNLVQALGTVNVAPAAFTVTLPAPTTPPVPPDAALTPRHYNTIGTRSDTIRPAAKRTVAAKTASNSTGAGPVLLAVVVVAAVAAIAAVAVGLRRRSRPVPIPSGWRTDPDHNPMPPWAPSWYDDNGRWPPPSGATGEYTRVGAPATGADGRRGAVPGRNRNRHGWRAATR